MIPVNVAAWPALARLRQTGKPDRRCRVDVWLYRGAGQLHALTIDQHAGNLPTDLGPWQLVSATVLKGGAVDEDEALSLIAEHGYCCFASERRDDDPAKEHLIAPK